MIFLLFSSFRFATQDDILKCLALYDPAVMVSDTRYHLLSDARQPEEHMAAGVSKIYKRDGPERSNGGCSHSCDTAAVFIVELCCGREVLNAR